jgi:hypothetical protein
MSMEWYRAYHNMPHDPKLQVVAKRCSQPMAFVVAVWVCILDAASQANPRGVIEIDPEEVAVIQGIELEAVEAIFDALKSKNLIDDEGAVVNWHKRQHTTSTERMKKLRDKKKQDVTGSDAKKRSVTSGDAKKAKNTPDTETEADTDSEENTDTETDSKKDSYSKNRTREEKRESEGEKQPSCGKDAEHSQTDILRQMADIWDAEVQSKLTNGNGQKAILTEKRKELLTARWIDDFSEDIRAWRYFCEIIGTSDFCLGKIDGKDWTIDLTWATQSSDRVAKILEGGFSGGKHPPKPPSCALPEYRDGWDQVIKRMTHHHGAAAIRSWFSNSTITTATQTPDGVMLTLELRSEFLCGWIEKNYLTDLNHSWGEVICSRPVIGVELKAKEATT